MYAQRRISSEILGEAYTCLEASTGQDLLRQAVENYGAYVMCLMKHTNPTSHDDFAEVIRR